MPGLRDEALSDDDYPDEAGYQAEYPSDPDPDKDLELNAGIDHFLKILTMKTGPELTEAICALQTVISQLKGDIVTAGKVLQAAKERQDAIEGKLIHRMEAALTLAGPNDNESESRSPQDSDWTSDTSRLPPIIAQEDKVSWETHADNDDVAEEELGDDEDEDEDEEYNFMLNSQKGQVFDEEYKYDE
ncbi:hypothetical protein OF83DRAFT_1174995 [Amylostereum chailletii]|nr:hypothetical protein OF83DRAFT_1174995 [Amylostereum chailletii]